MSKLGVATLLLGVAACVPAMDLSGSGTVSEASLPDFAGEWQGSTQIAARAHDMSIRLAPDASGGFRLDMTTLEAEIAAGSATVSGVTERRRSLSFTPSVLATWTAADVAEGETATAWIDGATLHVDIMRTGVPGGPIDQSYEATLAAPDRIALDIEVAAAGTRAADARAELVRAGAS